jgi:putative tryptophan/tyrosine transport system substrate-binding protein
MRRRQFIAGVSAAAMWPACVVAQAPQLPVIGLLSSGSPQGLGGLLAAYRDGLRERGYVEGGNVLMTFRWAEGRYNELEALANDLVLQRVNLIVAQGGLVSARAAMKATTSIPILFVVGFDPAQLGLVKSLNQPGGNATGVSLFTSELLPKQLSLLHELGPRIRSTAFLVNPDAVTAAADIAALAAAAQQKGYQLDVYKARGESEIAAAFQSIGQEQVSALLVAPDPFFISRRDQIVKLAAQFAIPALYPWREYVEASGLMSYGTGLPWAYNLLGHYTSRILGGEKANTLPVQQPTNFELVINLKTAKALGLTIPETLLATADEVIQ